MLTYWMFKIVKYLETLIIILFIIFKYLLIFKVYIIKKLFVGNYYLFIN